MNDVDWTGPGGVAIHGGPPPSATDAKDQLIAELKNMVTTLRLDLREQREENRRLWLACGRLQLAHGVYDGLVSQACDQGEAPDHTTATRADGYRDDAIKLLNGLVALTPEKEAK